jgi:hypothetical protein
VAAVYRGLRFVVAMTEVQSPAAALREGATLHRLALSSLPTRCHMDKQNHAIACHKTFTAGTSQPSTLANGPSTVKIWETMPSA